MSGGTNKRVCHHFHNCSNKERAWVKDPSKNDQKWKPGTGCLMERSLGIPATNSAIRETIKSIVAKSNVLKENVKTDLLRDKDKEDEEFRSGLRNQRKIERRIKRSMDRVEVSIAQFSEISYRQMKFQLMALSGKSIYHHGAAIQ